MWIASFKSKAHSSSLSQAVDLLESTGLLPDLRALLLKAKTLSPSLNLADMLSVSKLLIEDIWSEAKKPEADMSTSKITFNNTSMNKSQSTKLHKSIIRKVDFPSNSSLNPYKLQVSQEVAYMVSST